MIAILKYNAGNIKSVENALKRLGYECCVTDDPVWLQQAKKVIFPGVGEASSAMKYLREKQLDRVIMNLTQPVLGICLGLQLMCKSTEEGNTTCLNIFDVEVKRFPYGLRVPHMGWNNLEYMCGVLFKDIEGGEHFYFVHSYYASIHPCAIATANYGIDFSAALQKDNFFATQFHPEKSSRAGETVLKNFLEL
jgi:glutamine amidotransferase